MGDMVPSFDVYGVHELDHPLGAHVSLLGRRHVPVIVRELQVAAHVLPHPGSAPEVESTGGTTLQQAALRSGYR